MPPSTSPLPGLGPRSWAMLSAAGVHNGDELKRLGSVRAFLRVQDSGQRPSLNLLWAMEGALSGEDWRVVARQHRTSLLLALDALQSARRDMRDMRVAHDSTLAPAASR